MNWKPVELVADYWIILADDGGYTEYTDSVGDNLMFHTKEQAEERIRQIEKEVL